MLTGIEDISTQGRITGLRPGAHDSITLQLTEPKRHGFAPALITYLPGLQNRYRSSLEGKNIVYTIADTTQPPYAAEIRLEYQEQYDPLIALSLNRVDATLLYQDDNIDAMKRRIGPQQVEQIDEAILFLSFGDGLSQEEREFLWGVVRSEPLLDQLSQRGENLDRILPRETPLPYILASPHGIPPQAPVELLYSSFDPLTYATAVALSFQLQQRGIQTRLIPQENRSRERMDGTHMIQVGRVDRSFLSRDRADVFLADYWFQGRRTEDERIQSFRQKTLFSLPLYLAIQDDLVLQETGNIYRRNDDE